MSKSPSQSNSESSKNNLEGVTPLRCLSNAAVLGSIATALYFLTRSVTQTYANKPIHSDNIAVVQMSVTVRTLVGGLCMMGTGVFAFLTFGLILVAIQLSIQRFTQRDTPSSDA
ncbi:MAG: DUF3082 domain-containing protein [Cyanobacteria bacterium J06592_8]